LHFVFLQQSTSRTLEFKQIHCSILKKGTSAIWARYASPSVWFNGASASAVQKLIGFGSMPLWGVFGAGASASAMLYCCCVFFSLIFISQLIVFGARLNKKLH